MDERLQKYDAIVFDVGNVLLTFEPGEVIKLAPQEYRDKLFAAMFGPESRWSAFDLGAESNEAIARRIARAAQVPDGESMVLHILYHFYETMRPLPLYRLIKALKAAGKKLYALTNYNEPAFSFTMEAYPDLKLLDGCLVSAREKLVKPDPEIYHLLIRRFSLTPQNTLFIDDTKPNVEAAAREGLNVWHYAGNGNIL